MIRGVAADGQQILVGLTRSSLELLLQGKPLLSPGFDGRGPDIVIVFAEDDKALRARLKAGGSMGPHTVEHDRRKS